MNEFLLALRQFLRGFRVWVVVSPWEQALRVRLGKRIMLLDSGWHWRLPVIDVVYLQSTRLRISPINKQTLSTLTGEVITLAGALGYQIDDIRLLYTSIHHAEDTVSNLIRAMIASYVSTHSLTHCTPEMIQVSMNAEVDLSRYGLGGAVVYITEFAVVRTYRLIGDYSEYAWGKRLATDVPSTSSGDQT